MRIDGRTLSHETSEVIRRLAVSLVKEGATPSEVIQSYGLCRTTIYKWLAAERRGGAAALAARKHPGRRPTLTPPQKLQVRRWIDGRDPRRYGFDACLWTRQRVAALIGQKLAVRLGVSAVGRLLAELGIRPPKASPRAYARGPDALARLRARAKHLGATILFLEERLVKAGARTVRALSAADARGAFFYQTYTGRLSEGRLAGRLAHLVRGWARPVFLVRDGRTAHPGRPVPQDVRRLAGGLELQFLPASAPGSSRVESLRRHARGRGR